MNRRHCDVCDKVLDPSFQREMVLVKTGRSLSATVEYFRDGRWVLSVDQCRECLGRLMMEYSLWLQQDSDDNGHSRSGN